MPTWMSVCVSVSRLLFLRCFADKYKNTDARVRGGYTANGQRDDVHVQHAVRVQRAVQVSAAPRPRTEQGTPAAAHYGIWCVDLRSRTRYCVYVSVSTTAWKPGKRTPLRRVW